MAGLVPGPKATRREIVRSGGKPAASTSVLGSLPHELGVVFSTQDMLYILLSAMDFASDPASLKRKAGLYVMLLKRTVPNTQFTRLRAARLLEGLETLSKALRVILTIEDFDILAEVQAVLVGGLENVSLVSDPSSGVTVEVASKRLGEAVAGVLARLQQNRDPRVKNALRVLLEVGRILDLTHDLPRLPAVGALDIRPLKQRRPRKSPRKGPAQ